MRTEQEMLAIVHGKAAAMHRRRRTTILGVAAATVVLLGIVAITRNGSSPTKDRVQVADSRTGSRERTGSSVDSSEQLGSWFSEFTGEFSTGSDGESSSTNDDEPNGDEPTSSDEATNGDEPIHDLTVEVSPNPTAGELVIVTLHVTNRRPDDRVGLQRGTTGPAWWEGPPSADRPFGQPCLPERDVPRSNGSYAFTAAFRLPGRHTLVAVLGQCPGSPEAELRIPVDIDVAGPAGPSNGPFAPYFLYGQASGGTPSDADPTATYVSFHLQDMDGVLDHLLIDWGDGTPTELVPIVLDPGYNTRACDSTQEYADTAEVLIVPHHYVATGSYTVTVTAYSVGCNGEQPHQQGSASGTVEAT